MKQNSEENHVLERIKAEHNPQAYTSGSHRHHPYVVLMDFWAVVGNRLSPKPAEKNNGKTIPPGYGFPYGDFLILPLQTSPFASPRPLFLCFTVKTAV